MGALQSETSQILLCNANLGHYSDGYHKIQLLEQNYLHAMDYTYKNFSPPLTLHSVFWRVHISKKDQVAVQFCLTSTMGLVASSSLSTASSSACFSLSFFFFFFLTGSPSSTAVPSVPQKAQKWKAGYQLLRLKKEKLWDVRGCNDSYLPSAWCLPAWLLPAIITVYNYFRHEWQCSDSTILIWWIHITLFLYAAPRV